MVVSLKTDLRFPIPGQQGHGGRIIHFCSQFREEDWYDRICGGEQENTLADAIMDRISYDSYKINIECIDPSKDRSMREVYGLDPKQAK